MEDQIRTLLINTFQKPHVDSLLRHFVAMTQEFGKGEWEHSIGKAGKFVEATLKAVAMSAGKTPPTGRAFKVDGVINSLGQLPDGSFDDGIRLTIPRAARFIYDIASNRGARHDPDKISPNEMDAIVSVSNCSWILAELIRISQKGATNMEEAGRLVAALTERKYPFVEDVDGRLYFHIRKKTGTDVALLALARRYPKRIAKRDLIETVKRNGFKEANARMAVQRILRLTDNDGSDQLRLLMSGLKEADRIIQERDLI
jgi:hypothetical protein